MQRTWPRHWKPKYLTHYSEKVINEQLRKIIELEKSKIEREEIERLEERINKNITIVNESTLKEKLKMIEGTAKAVGIKRKEVKMIKI